MESAIFLRAYGRDIKEEEQSLQIGRILTNVTMTEVITMKQIRAIMQFLKAEVGKEKRMLRRKEWNTSRG